MVIDGILLLLPFIVFVAAIACGWGCLRWTQVPTNLGILYILAFAVLLSFVLPGMPALVSASSAICLIFGFAAGYCYAKEPSNTAHSSEWNTAIVKSRIEQSRCRENTADRTGRVDVDKNKSHRWQQPHQSGNCRHHHLRNENCSSCRNDDWME